MTLLSILLLILISGICGSIGAAIAGSGRRGCLVSIALGFVGAVLGMWLAGVLGAPEFLPLHIGGRSFPVVWSIIGSALFVAIVAAVVAPPLALAGYVLVAALWFVPDARIERALGR